MTDKTPIDPSEIRHRDLIRWESPTSDTAREFRHTDPNGRHTAPGTYYLLDRPTPPVDLPTKPTLGWAFFGDHLQTAPRFYNADPDGYVVRNGVVLAWKVNDLSSFTPATAVPTEALDELRRRSTCYGDGSPTSDFLTAVDKANEAQS